MEANQTEEFSPDSITLTDQSTGETMLVDLTKAKKLKFCKNGKHDMQPDHSDETDSYLAYSCTKCGRGRLLYKTKHKIA